MAPSRVPTPTTSVFHIMHLEKLMTGEQDPDELISALIAHLSERWSAFVNSQGTGFTLNNLNEELFCWTLIQVYGSWSV
jgi:hypothetical protein